jgi:hypothetical protein
MRLAGPRTLRCAVSSDWLRADATRGGGDTLADLAARTADTVTILERTVNGQPGLVAQQDGVTVTVFAFEVTGDRITRIWAVRNPDKLRSWTAR